MSIAGKAEAFNARLDTIVKALRADFLSVLAPLTGVSFAMTAGERRRARAKAIHDRTGWVFARCREMVDTMTDVQIEAAVRQHEAGR